MNNFWCRKDGIQLNDEKIIPIHVELASITNSCIISMICFSCSDSDYCEDMDSDESETEEQRFETSGE